MPQMSPMSWLILFFMFTLLFLFFNILNYFNFMPLFKTQKSENKTANNNIYMNWKW